MSCSSESDIGGSIFITDNDKVNLIDTSFMANLDQAARNTGDNDAWVGIVKVEGDDHCGGVHPKLSWRKSLRQLDAFILGINQTFATVERLPLPAIAVVQCKAMCGGFELALRCDFVVVVSDAEFRLLESDFGCCRWRKVRSALLRESVRRQS